MHHATTSENEQRIMLDMSFNGSFARSSYDGPMSSLEEGNVATSLAYFSIAPISIRKLAPFSAFPRSAEPGASIRMACVNLTIVDNLINSGAKLYHVATTPSQKGKWQTRRYQSHVVVVPKEHVSHYENKPEFLELDPDRNSILFRSKSSSIVGKTRTTWMAATKLRERTNEESIRKVQVIIAFASGLRFRDSSLIRWINAYKYRSVGRGFDLDLECPLCPQRCHSRKDLNIHFCSKHMEDG